MGIFYRYLVCLTMFLLIHYVSLLIVDLNKDKILHTKYMYNKILTNINT